MTDEKMPSFYELAKRIGQLEGVCQVVLMHLENGGSTQFCIENLKRVLEDKNANN